jgi:hypothetical protein
MPLANDNILSKAMTTNVAAYGSQLKTYPITHFFVVYKRHNVNGMKIYLAKEV